MTREEAIKWLNVERELIIEMPQDNSRELIEAYNMAIRSLGREPRPKAKWVTNQNNYDYIECSNCGKEAYWDTDYGQQKFDFCPNCGADMRRGKR